MDSITLKLCKYLGIFILFIFLIPTFRKYLTDEETAQLSQAETLMSHFWSIETITSKERTSDEKIKFKEAKHIYETAIAKRPSWQAYYDFGRSQRAFGYYINAQNSLACAYDLMPERIEIIV